MKKNFTLLIIMMCSTLYVEAQRCGTQDLHHFKMENDPAYKIDWLNNQESFKKSLKKIEKLQNTKAAGDCPTNKVTVPVVIHYQYNAPANEQACLIELATSQIAVMNSAYSGSTCTVSGTGSCINFVIATLNHPSGTGVQEGQPAILFNSNPCAPGVPCNVNAWNGYLNLIVQDAQAAPNLLGIASLGGNPMSANSAMVTSCAWGTSATTCTSNLTGGNFVNSAHCQTNYPAYTGGITVTHEVGHWLNLQHTFCIDGLNLNPQMTMNSITNGSVTSAQASADPANYGMGSAPAGGCMTAQCDCDGVSDTPPQAFAEYSNTNCSGANPSSGAASFSYNNVMDYGNDVCLKCFTPGQKTRVVAHCDVIKSQFKANTTGASVPASCGITSITGANPVMVNDATYSVTVSWVGVEADGAISATGGTPTSVVTSATNGSQVFTFPIGQAYSLTFSDTDNSCSSVTRSGLSGVAPTFGGGPTTPVETIPTLGEWGIMIMFFSLLIIGLVYMRNVYVSTKKTI